MQHTLQSTVNCEGDLPRSARRHQLSRVRFTPRIHTAPAKFSQKDEVAPRVLGQLAPRGCNMSQTDAVRELLDNDLRVTLTDGRILVGTFSCFDKQRNVLLTNVSEYRKADDGRLGCRRNLGIVLVPRRWITACHAAEVS